MLFVGCMRCQQAVQYRHGELRVGKGTVAGSTAKALGAVRKLTKEECIIRLRRVMIKNEHMKRIKGPNQ